MANLGHAGVVSWVEAQVQFWSLFSWLSRCQTFGRTGREPPLTAGAIGMEREGTGSENV